MKFFPHILILVRCKILRLDMQKNNFQFLLLFTIEMVVLSVFSHKKGFGPLGVKVMTHFIKYCREQESRK